MLSAAPPASWNTMTRAARRLGFSATASRMGPPRPPPSAATADMPCGAASLCVDPRPCLDALGPLCTRLDCRCSVVHDSVPIGVAVSP